MVPVLKKVESLDSRDESLLPGDAVIFRRGWKRFVDVLGG